MSTEAIIQDPAGEVKVTAPAALASGAVIQLADGRAGVYAGLKSAAAGDLVTIYTQGRYRCLKTADIAMLDGGRAYWDRSANAAHFRPASGDFFMGSVRGDAAAAGATVDVLLNQRQHNLIEYDGNPGPTLWTHGASLGLGVVAATPSSRAILAFDAVAEAAMAAIYPAEARDHIPVADGPICEMRVAIYDIGDDGSLDITLGLANGTHATDFDLVTEFVGFHLDGNALSILAESDDGTTEVAATDTTVDAVDDTEFEVWLDCRNIADIQLYVDGVNVLPATVFTLAAATGPVFPIVHLEKTSNDTTADVRVTFIRCRATDLTS